MLLLACTMGGCSFAPAYRVPASSVPAAAYPDAGDWKVAVPGDEQPRGEWWKTFQDPTLDGLEAKVGPANEDIKAAVARLAQARAQTRIQRAGLFPNLNVASSASRSRTSPNSPRFPAGYETLINNFDLEADLSYEFDVWGRVRNSVNAAKAGQQASAADLGALDLSVRAELAADYFNLRGEDAQQELLDTTVADYAKSLHLTENLYHGGGAAAADVDQARAQLETARTQAADTRLQRAVTEHAIAVLLGENPSSYHLDAAPLAADASPPAVDPGLPSSLLERRPDVAAAERRVAAANFSVGVARAAYFPQFTLAASFGYDSTQTANWLNAPSRMWSAGPAGVLTVFDAGRHRAQADQARAVLDEQSADYRAVVLSAYREVEDNLAAIRRLREERESQGAAVTAAARALRQSQYRYQAGLVTYLDVVINETAYLQAQLANVNIQIRLLNAGVLLIKALGGGWNATAAGPVRESSAPPPGLSAAPPRPPPDRKLALESAPSTGPASAYRQ